MNTYKNSIKTLGKNGQNEKPRVEHKQCVKNCQFTAIHEQKHDKNGQNKAKHGPFIFNAKNG